MGTMASRSSKVKIFLTSFLLVSLLESNVAARSDDMFSYSVIDGGVTITACLDVPEKLIIPSSIESLPVTTIAEFACPNRGIKELTLPSTLKEIGFSAFEANLFTSINLPDSLSTIGSRAFSNGFLQSVKIPDSVSLLGTSAFEKNALTSVSISENLKKIEGYAFYYNQLKSVTIPNSVTYIGEGAFLSNQLTTVTIPNSVTNIDKDAFCGNRLNSIKIPESVTTIGDSAFGSNNLTSLVIPKSVSRIGFQAFSMNKDVKMVTFLGDAPVCKYIFDYKPSKIIVPIDAQGFDFSFEDIPVSRTGVAIHGQVSSPPTYVSGAKIVGTGQVGKALTAQAGTWVGSKPITITFQWYRCTKRVKTPTALKALPSGCEVISGATTRVYIPARSQKTKYLGVLIKAQNLTGLQTVMVSRVAPIK